MPFRRTPLTLHPLCLALALVACQASVAPQPPVLPAATESAAVSGATLEGPITLDLEIKAGDRWQASLAPREDTYFLAVVEQRSLDVAATLIDLGDAVVATADGPGGMGVEERLAVRLAPGDYQLVLQAKPDGPQRGRVRLRIEALREFEPGDFERIRLTRLGHEAAHLDGSNSQVDWATAYDLSLEELEGWREFGDLPAVIRTLNRIASLEREFGELELSIGHAQEALQLSVDLGDAAAQGASYYWLAQSFTRAGRAADAAVAFTRGLAAAEESGDLALQGRLLNWQGRLHYNRAELREARQLWDLALDKRRQADDQRGIAPLLNNLGVIAEALGESAQALDYFQQSGEAAQYLGNPGEALKARANLATLLGSRGQWEEALSSLEADLETARAGNDQRHEAILGTKLAQLLSKLGEPEPAKALLERSLAINRESHEGFSEAWDLLILADVEVALGDLDAAQAYLADAADVSEREQLHVQKAKALRGLAWISLQQGDPLRATQLLEPLLEDPALRSQPLRHAVTLKDLGQIQLELGDADQALYTLGDARRVLGGLVVPEIRFEIAYLMARAHGWQGHLEAALREGEAALDLIESLRLSVDSPDLRATFLARTREAYDFVVDGLLELHRQQPDKGFDRRAFETLERSRARSLVEMLARAGAGAEQSVPTALLEAERGALAALSFARRQLDGPSGGGENLSALETELETARQALAEAEGMLKERAPRYASLRYATRSTVEQVQAALAEGTALVEFSLRPVGSVAFVVTRSQLTVVELPDEERIASVATLFRATLTEPSRRAFGRLLGHARALGDLVMAPLLDSIGTSDRLIIVPDGALSYIPFEALRLAGTRPQTGEDYLVERWVTSYAPSAGVLLSLQQEPPTNAGRGFAGFADPRPPTGSAPRAGVRAVPGQPLERLPGARVEVATIASRLVGEGGLTLMDAAASEEALKTRPEVRSARWLHVASHALIDERTPANSSIVLAPSGREDGFLTVQEIFGLKLDAELVVLSGCETALGRQIRGEGLIGLTRAFLYAGARGMQVSLWKVADETTPALMASFYAGLQSDLGAAQSLRQAKLESLRDPARAHPFYWAPFVVITG